MKIPLLSSMIHRGERVFNSVQEPNTPKTVFAYTNASWAKGTQGTMLEDGTLVLTLVCGMEMSEPQYKRRHGEEWGQWHARTSTSQPVNVVVTETSIVSVQSRGGSADVSVKVFYDMLGHLVRDHVPIPHIVLEATPQGLRVALMKVGDMST